MKIAEVRNESVKEYQKSQNIRLLDVFAIGPMMIYAGTFKQLPMWLRIGLIATGAATVVYNGKNYLINKKNDNNARNTTEKGV